MFDAGRPHLLPASAEVPAELAGRLGRDSLRFARDGLPRPLEGYLLDELGLDVSASYAGLSLRNPWGKASGQLSLNLSQLEEAAEAGLGFVVLKTVIAQDSSGSRSMSAWAIKEARMVAEPITSPLTGATGWTVTWRGRGWWQSFDDYLALVRRGTALGVERGMPVVPSVKYHLPGPDEKGWRVDEYETTTRAIVSAYREGGGAGPMPIEKDFSPTLAGSDRATQRETSLEWLRRVPDLIRAAAPGDVRVGLKLFNSLDDDEFQLALLAEAHGPHRPDFLVYANRLFDPDREFDGTRGVAYGGPDLSDRNLRLLSRFRSAVARGELACEPLEVSATGDVGTGRMAVEYALRGCSSFQIHTLFQLPAEEFAMRRGTKLERAVHRLVFDPDDGFVVWCHHAARRLGLGTSPVRLLDIAARGAASALTPADLARGA